MRHGRLNLEYTLSRDYAENPNLKCKRQVLPPLSPPHPIRSNFGLRIHKGNPNVTANFDDRFKAKSFLDQLQDSNAIIATSLEEIEAEIAIS